MSKSKYKTLKPGEPSPVIKRDHIIACCDCGLVHRFRFGVIYVGKKAMRMRPETIKRLARELDPRVQFRAWRLPKQTANRRRSKNNQAAIFMMARGVNP